MTEIFLLNRLSCVVYSVSEKIQLFLKYTVQDLTLNIAYAYISNI